MDTDDDAAEHVGNASRNGSDCPSGKVQLTAQGAADWLDPKLSMHPYLCPDCGLWHVSRQVKMDGVK